MQATSGPDSHAPKTKEHGVFWVALKWQHNSTPWEGARARETPQDFWLLIYCCRAPWGVIMAKLFSFTVSLLGAPANSHLLISCIFMTVNTLKNSMQPFSVFFSSHRTATSMVLSMVFPSCDVTSGRL